MTIAPLLALLSGFPGPLFLVIGAFYAFGGWFVAKRLLVEIALERALGIIGGDGPDEGERLRLGWLLFGSGVTFASGVALALQSSLAVWLFVVGTAQQAVHLLFLAPKIFDADEAPDPAGRQKTVNAAIGYGVVAIGVIWAGTAGRLLPLTGAGAIPSLATAIAALVFTGWIARHVLSPMGERSGGGGDLQHDDDDDVAV